MCRTAFVRGITPNNWRASQLNLMNTPTFNGGWLTAGTRKASNSAPGPRTPFLFRLSQWIWPRNVKRLRCLPRLFLFGSIKRYA